MKAITKFLLCILLVNVIWYSAFSQATTKKSASQTAKAKKKTTTPAQKPAPPVYGKDITIIIHNTCERDVAIFAGAKEDVQKPKITTLGGLGKNTVHIRENQVVCVVQNGKAIACTTIKPGTTQVEVNSSGNGVSIK